MLALFFAAVALLLAGIGLYSVLDYSVAQRSREIGIRIAIAGLLLAVASSRVVEPMLYQVKSADLAPVAIPVSAILLVSVCAALRAVTRAVRIGPAVMLRIE